MKANTSNAGVADQQMPPQHLACGRMPAGVLMLLTTTVCAHAQFEYTNYHHEITITKYTGAGGEVVIPGEIRGTPVVRIGPSAFSNCTTLTAVTIPEGVTSIGTSAFQGCANLTSFILPNTLTTLGARAFYSCTSLTSITVPGSITQWPVATNYYSTGSWVFAECTNLTAVTIGEGISSIPSYAFSRCIRLGTVPLPRTLSSIGESAFGSCSSLTSVRIPNSVTRVEGSAFYGCINLTNVTLGSGVTNIAWGAAGAFDGCSSLSAINVDALNPAYSSVEGVVLDKNQTALIKCPQGRTGNYSIPDGVTTVGSRAFMGCSKLTGVTFPDGVTTIDQFAFSTCVSLTSVRIPNTVSSIGGFAFGFSSSLTGVTIPNSVTFLGAYAFCGCTSLTNITVPGGVTNWEVITWPGLLGTPPLTVSGTFGGCTNLRTVTVEDGVTNIPAGAFAGCSHLTCITIPQSVTSLGTAPAMYAESSPVFGGCTNLTGIYFEGNCPSLLSDLGASATTTVYYLPDTAGWEATYGGYPTALWRPRIQTSDASFGVQSNQFGFNIRWASRRYVVIEACSELSTGLWAPVATNTLPLGSSYFSDPDWSEHPQRVYRLKWP